MFSILFVFVTSLNLVTTIGSSVSAQIHLKEDSRIGTQVADAALLLNLTTSTTGFKLLSEKLVRSQRNSLGARVRRKWLKLDKNSGRVTLLRHVDREEMCGDFEACAILLEIFSSERRQILNLKVVIDDVNDNRPEFSTDRISVEVSESARVNDVINLSEFMARDADQGNNSAISYSISSNPYFALEEANNEMNPDQLLLRIKKKLDHETDPIQRMTLIASDHGVPPQKNFVEVEVRISDVNDNDPEFQKQEYSVTLPENLQSGQKIAQVHASDADPGDSGTLRYSVSRRNKKIARNLIDVNPVTGDVTLRQILDRELHDKLRILIEARDSNETNQRVGRTWLQINVQDVNDNAPEIEVKFVLLFDEKTGYLPEDSPVGTVIAYLTAKDPDSGQNGKVNLSIESVSPEVEKTKGQADKKNPFNLTKSGFICLKQKIDREKTSSYIIKIKACDQGSPPQCSTEAVIVKILDVNDHQPFFDSPSVNVVLAEDTKTGSIVTTVHASDKDATNQPAIFKNEHGKIASSPFGEVYYHIINGDGTLAIDSKTGEITLMQELDREVIDQFWVTVRAKDGGRQNALQSTCKVYVTVTDVNDNKPSFTNDNITYYATILRNDVLLNIQAVDYDAKENGTITYEVLSVDGKSMKGISSLFLLDSISGELRLNFSNVDLNSSLGLHRIKVEATDKGAPPLRSARVFDVMITDWEELPGLDEKGFAITSVTGLSVIAASSILFLMIVIGLILVSKKCQESKSKTYLPSVEQSVPDSNNDAVIKKNFLNDETDEIEADALTRKELAEDERFNSISNQRGYSPASSTQENLAKHSQQQTKNKFHQKPENTPEFKKAKNTQKTYIALPSASSNDVDSGRGDSDPDAPINDVTMDHGHHFNATNRIEGGGYRCTNQCLVLGHSDSCWMHLPYPDTRISQQQPQSVDANSSFYVELSTLPPPKVYPDYNNRHPAGHRMTSGHCFNYPANELSSIYSDVIIRNPRHETKRHVQLKATPLSICQEQEESLRFSPTSCLSAPVTFNPRCEPRPNQHLIPQENLKRKPNPQDFLPMSQVRGRFPILRSASADLLDNSRTHTTQSTSFQGQTLPKRHTAKRLSSAFNMSETKVIVDDIDKLLYS